MLINQIFELTMTVDTENFVPLFKSVVRNSSALKENEDYLIDYSLEHKGLLFFYRNSTYQKKIKVMVNADLLLNGEESNSHRLLQKLKKQLDKYMDGGLCLDEFRLSKITTTSDINVGSQANVDAYLKVLRRIGRVKRFTPVENDFFTLGNGFCLSGNSNHTDFMLYSLKDLLRQVRKEVVPKVDGIIVAEVCLNKPSAIRNYCSSTDVSEQIVSLYEQRVNVFFDVMTRIIPDGGFCKKLDAVDYIRREVKDTRLRRRMIRLVTLIPEKRSLLLAQKALQYRHVDVLMEEFSRIGLSPVTIGKRQDEKHLPSLYSYME